MAVTMLQLSAIRTLLAILTFPAFSVCTDKTYTPCSINTEAFGFMLVTSRYTKFIELLQKCPFEVLEAAGHFFLSYPRLNAHLLKDLPPVSVDELYGCGVIDRRGKLSPLKKDGVIPRLIPDIQTQMGNIVQRLMVKIQTLVRQYGWTWKSKCKSASALDDTFKLLNKLLCCKHLISCTKSYFKLPEGFIRDQCNDGPQAAEIKF